MSGLPEDQVLGGSAQKEFSEKQSDRQEVDLLREIHTPQTEFSPFQKARVVPKYEVVSFYELGNFIG